MTRLFLFFLLFFFNYSYSQTSDLGRFTVNVKSGCIPLEIEIISENIDSSVSVVQYDFNYNTTNNLFNPSSGKSYTYNSKGKYVIAQAINQDGVEKIDILEIEAYEIKDINIDLRNCSNYSIEINIDDDQLSKLIRPEDISYSSSKNSNYKLKAESRQTPPERFASSIRELRMTWVC